MRACVTKCEMSILRFMLCACMLASTLLVTTTILQDFSTPAADMEGTLALLQDPGYIIKNSELCNSVGNSLKIIILVTSAPDHFKKRQSIRFTWGHFSLRRDITIAFFIGAVSNTSLQERLVQESLTYSDVIQNKNVDSYQNLTLKTLSMLQWVNKHCSGIGFILKTDDDVFVNVPRLLLFVDKHNETKNTIFGNVARNWRPIRSKKSKYYVSPEAFRDPLYPSFTTGPAYLMTGDVPRRLIPAALKKATFPLEDVFFTGIVAEKLSIIRIHDLQFHPYLKKKQQHDVLKTISIHNLTTHQQFSLWDKLINNLDNGTK